MIGRLSGSIEVYPQSLPVVVPYIERLSDGTLKGIKPQATTDKIADRDGMYLTASPRARSLFVSTTGSTAGAKCQAAGLTVINPWVNV